MTEAQINQTIARIMNSTITKKRQFSLFEVALDIESLKKEKGSMSEVAKIVRVSAGMLNQFLSVFKLPKEIIELVKERKIDSVSAVHSLSKFQKSDSVQLAELVKIGKVSSQDLKILFPYRKQYPTDNIIELINRINKSKNIKVSVIKFSKEDLHKDQEKFKSELESLIGKENIVAINTDSPTCDIKIKKEGEKLLRQIAKNTNQTLQEYIITLLK